MISNQFNFYFPLFPSYCHYLDTKKNQNQTGLKSFWPKLFSNYRHTLCTNTWTSTHSFVFISRKFSQILAFLVFIHFGSDRIVVFHYSRVSLSSTNFLYCAQFFISTGPCTWSFVKDCSCLFVNSWYIFISFEVISGKRLAWVLASRSRSPLWEILYVYIWLFTYLFILLLRFFFQ